ncbi:MAG: hypothetical protein EP343_08655 [Deltaproteobacteria bacterium]|nr:MAG: hypothetical protein EP343_08655 [Deltaproteobacteria bacterium]
MGAISFSLECKPDPKSEVEADPNALEELFYELTEVIEDYLKKTLKSGTERDYVEDLGEVVEVDSDELEELRLTFLFKDHWHLGSELAYHWYQHALCAKSVRKELNEKLLDIGLKLEPIPFDLEDLVHELPDETTFVPLDDGMLVAVSTEGEYGIDGEEGDWTEIDLDDLDLSELEMDRLEEAADARLCQCQLCRKGRK